MKPFRVLQGLRVSPGTACQYLVIPRVEEGRAVELGGKEPRQRQLLLRNSLSDWEVLWHYLPYFLPDTQPGLRATDASLLTAGRLL